MGINRRDFLKGLSVFVFGIGVPDFVYGGTGMKSLDEIYFKMKDVFPSVRDRIIVDGGRQKLYLLRDGFDSPYFSDVYSVSTSKYGFGNKRGSKKTPVGLHMIAGKYGGGVSVGTIFEDWRSTGKKARIVEEARKSKKRYVVTRIMTLVGCERENIDVGLRGIHIHGTNEEGFVGMRKSSGCIGMKSLDVIDLYDSVGVGTPVYIAESLR
jgi:hypothetical protein